MQELNMSEMSLINYLKNEYEDISILSPDEILREAFAYENTLEATSQFDVLDIDEEKIYAHISSSENDEYISRRRR